MKNPADGFDLAALLPWILVAVVTAIAVAVIWVLVRRARTAETPPAPATPSPVIDDLIAIIDLTQSPAVRNVAHRALARLGATPVDPPSGSVFDPVEQRAVQTRPTSDAPRAGTIAETVRAGYRVGDRTVRPPDVIVWSLEEEA